MSEFILLRRGGDAPPALVCARDGCTYTYSAEQARARAEAMRSSWGAVYDYTVHHIADAADALRDEFERDDIPVRTGGLEAFQGLLTGDLLPRTEARENARGEVLDDDEIDELDADRPEHNLPVLEAFLVEARAAPVEGAEASAPAGNPRAFPFPDDPAVRKGAPMAAGVLDYFPNALFEVARVSKAGNDQHNPGQPLHWARDKSADHADCIIRHLSGRGAADSDGQRHSAKLAWRALALLQEELENER